MRHPTFCSLAGLLGIVAAAASLPARTLEVQPLEPPGATTFRTIGEAAAAAQPGDTVRIAAGVYRESVKLARSGKPGAPIVFEAVGTVTITGSEKASPRWTRAGAIYHTGWKAYLTDQKNPVAYARPSSARFGDSLFGDLIVLDGRILPPVDRFDDLADWSYWIDRAQGTLSVRLPEGCVPGRLEYGARATLWDFAGNVEFIVLRGIRFSLAANTCETPMVRIGAHWQMERCVLDGSSGLGLRVVGNAKNRSGARIVASRFLRHGGLSVAVSGYDVAFDRCDFGFNNWRGFHPEYGVPSKVYKVGDVRFIACRSYWNTGPGFWFDMARDNLLVHQCRIFGNHGWDQDAAGKGIFVEATYGPVSIRENVIFSNTGAGVDVAESGSWIEPDGSWRSAGVTVIGNTFAANGPPFSVRLLADGPSGSRSDDGPSPGPPHLLGPVTFAENILYEPAPDASHYRRTGAPSAVFLANDGTLRGDSAHFRLDRPHLELYGIRVDRNTYHAPFWEKLNDAPLVFAHAYGFLPPRDEPDAGQAHGLSAARSRLGFETNSPPAGRKATRPPPFTVPVFSRVRAPTPIPFSSALAKTDDAVLAVYRRSSIENLAAGGGRATIYDVRDRPLLLVAPSAEARAVLELLPDDSLPLPVYLRVQSQPKAMAATVTLVPAR